MAKSDPWQIVVTLLHTCTLQVREFSVTDIQPFPIKLVWDNTGAIDENKGPGEMEVRHTDSWDN